MMNRMRKFRMAILSVFLFSSLTLFLTSPALAVPIVFNLGFGGTVSYAGGESAFTTTNGAVTSVGNGTTTIEIIGGDLDFVTGNYVGGGTTANGFENIYAGGGSVTIYGDIGSGLVLLLEGRFANTSTFSCCTGSSPVYASSFNGILEVTYIDPNLAAALGFNLPAAEGSLAQVEIFFGTSPVASGVAFSGSIFPAMQGGGALSVSEVRLGPLVAIDPGHGKYYNVSGELVYQRDPSPVPPGHGIIEDELTLQISQNVKTRLSRKNIRTLLTRDADLILLPNNCPLHTLDDGSRSQLPCLADLKKRVELAVRKKVQLFVSIHTNGGPPTGHGTETWYCGVPGLNPKVRESRELAQSILNQQIALGLKGRNNGVAGKKCYNILHTRADIPAALTEVAFHSNVQLALDQTNSSDLDETKLSDPLFLENVGEAIATAIKNFFK